MLSRRLRIVGLSVLWLAAGRQGVRADQPAASSPGKETAAANRDAQALAAKIDQFIAARWAGQGVKPADWADDAEFMRRAYLDLAGRIPPVSEVRDFLEDKRADKRQRLVEDLLESPHYVNHFTNVWRDLLLPQGGGQQVQFLAPALENWLRAQLRDNVPYDKMVREVLTTPANGSPRRRQPLRLSQGDENLTAFYEANEMKPENLAASTSRLFLGVKLECAQCHDHPFARWTRKQFWEYAAFFSGIQRNKMEQKDRHDLKIPGSEKVVQARFLDGKQPAWQPGRSTRTTLADWVTAPDNPYFARTAVNRLWAHFFGVGLVEPIDDLSEDNPPSHAELLDELARQLAAHQFDVKFLIRALTFSRTYQLTSALSQPSPNEARLFARMAIKGLTPEQIFDSLSQATGYREDNPNPRPFFAGQSPRAEFLAKFANQDKPTESQTSILQALTLMNGKIIADATSLERSKTLAAVATAPFFDGPEQRVEALFLATLTRKPHADEAERFAKYIKSAGPKGEKSALADVFWALLNSSEFILNH